MHSLMRPGDHCTYKIPQTKRTHMYTVLAEGTGLILKHVEDYHLGITSRHQIKAKLYSMGIVASYRKCTVICYG